jgi:hypothetical protein
MKPSRALILVKTGIGLLGLCRSPPVRQAHADRLLPAEAWRISVQPREWSHSSRKATSIAMTPPAANALERIR